MIDKELKNAIVEKQGNLLYTTLAEECTELAQACCKINRQKFYNKNIVKELDNFFEEICDVQLNLELIKEQVIKETGMSEIEYDQYIRSWNTIKQDKLSSIFLKKDMTGRLFQAGYVAEDGEPIKCEYCGSRDLEDCDFYKEDLYVVEYNKRCKQCRKYLGTWAYGKWNP